METGDLVKCPKGIGRIRMISMDDTGQLVFYIKGYGAFYAEQIHLVSEQGDSGLPGTQVRD